MTMSDNRTNAYRTAQKQNAKLPGHRRFDRVEVTLRRRHYYQQSCNRLFICYGAEQVIELRKLCGREITPMATAQVAFRRLHDPFREEVDLAPR